jgi:hypothetical protein
MIYVRNMQQHVVQATQIRTDCLTRTVEPSGSRANVFIARSAFAVSG